MACMTPAAEGTRISIEDKDARELRASVIEWLMINHPHDCPVCDEGGECHLQDMTVMTGHDYRRYRFTKRTHHNQDLGPFINHEMNRCIQCYRCVRFYRDYAGGRDFDVFGCHDDVYFGRHTDGTLENEFSGNLVEVCPTGVFDDKTFMHHYTRKWDLQTSPSVCVHCAVGCNTIPGERYGELRRIRNRYHHQVNGYFLCDRGRYGYEFVNGPERVRAPMVRQHADAAPAAATSAEVRQRLVELCAAPPRIVGIGSPRASLESNFALQILVGAERFCMGVSERERRLLLLAHALLRDGGARAASVRDVETADAALVLGEDVPAVAPRLALALRQLVRQAPMKIPDELGIPRWNDAAVREAIQHERGPLFVAATTDTRLDDIATALHRAAPDELARLGFAIAQALDPAAPEVEVGEDMRALAGRIAEALLAAARPIIVVGTTAGSEPLLHAAANIARALAARGKDARLALVLPESNSLGSAMLGGASLEAALEILRRGEADTLVVVENDLFRRIDERTAQALLGAARNVVVIDHVLTQTARHADVLLPAATFAEASGTLVSSEGRAQRFFDTFVPAGEVRAAWRWIADILDGCGHRPGWTNLDELLAAIARARPEIAGIVDAAPPARFRMTGQRIARQPHRYSGRTAMRAQLTIHEPPPPADSDAPLAYSMEGSACQPPAPLVPFFWSPGWNSIQALNRFQEEVGGLLRGGEAGVRLLEASATLGYVGEAPPRFEPRPGQWLVVPSYSVFGSEELSVLSPGVAARTAAPSIALNPDDAGALRLAGEARVVVALPEGTWTVALRMSSAIPHGVAALSVGLPQLRFAALPAWGVLQLTPRGDV
jgi:NADH-quinone oxidoreductase subunit G